MSDKPLIAHVLYSLDTGGMERFVATLVNHTGDRYRHALVCLTKAGAVRAEIVDRGVSCVALHKKPGKDWACYFRFWRTMRTLKPDLVHSYNIGTLDLAPVAKLAGIRHVVHAERGRDAIDPAGKDRKYRRLRRWMAPFITIYLPVSRDLESWLLRDVGIGPTKVRYIPNGIDVRRFGGRSDAAPVRPVLRDFAPPGTLLIVNVGRLDPVKDQAGLLDAFRMLGERNADIECRLVIVGEGPEHERLQQGVHALGLDDVVRLLGNRDDVPELLREADIFALSSIAEGMPGVVLEAMASGLPVVATCVGGVDELVVDGETGMLVAPRDTDAMADALARYLRHPDLRVRHGDAGRTRAGSRFSLTAMLSAYRALYDGLLAVPTRRRSHAAVGVADPGEH